MADKTLAASAGQHYPCELDASNQLASEMVVFLGPKHSGVSVYLGTRADVEAEHVVPGDIEWPTGSTVARGQARGFRFTLHRDRPKGFKGSRKLWLQTDWWRLQWEPIDGPSFGEREIAQKSSDLAEAFLRYSPKGEASFRALIERAVAADLDTRFQDFKAILFDATRTRPLNINGCSTSRSISATDHKTKASSSATLGVAR